MVRPLFFEYGEDPTSWLTEDQYMFGTYLLVAPLMEEGRDRGAYLPPGRWADYQSGGTYDGGTWHRLLAGEVSTSGTRQGRRADPSCTAGAKHRPDRLE